MRAAHPGKLQWLQALRGVAALLVVFFHLGPHWALVPELAFLTPLMHWGFSGVDIFFVLSGFVVHQSTRELRWGPSLRTYALRRCARIYLTYWPTLALVVVLNLWVLNKPLPGPETIWRSVLLLEPSIDKNWLPVAWSLTYELYFYVLLGVLMLAPVQRQSRLILCLIAVIVFWNCAWLIGQRELVYAARLPLRFPLSGYIVEFMAGALVSLWMQSRERHGQPLMTADNGMNWVVGGASCALLGLAVGTTSPYFDRVEIMRVASFGLLGLGGLLSALALQHTRAAPPAWLVRIGDCSFGLYLLHAVLLDLLGKIRFEHQLTGNSLLAVSLFAPVAVVLSARIWFRLVEGPSVRLARRLR